MDVGMSCGERIAVLAVRTDDPHSAIAIEDVTEQSTIRYGRLG